jgi:hypothetical protein
MWYPIANEMSMWAGARARARAWAWAWAWARAGAWAWAGARAPLCGTGSAAAGIYRAALGGDWGAAMALCDLYQDSENTMRAGEPVYVDGPLDITIGIVESIDGAWLRLAPGAVTTREVVDETKLVATGLPSGTTYCVHPRGRLVALLAVTGYSPLPKFDPKDWPPLG